MSTISSLDFIWEITSLTGYLYHAGGRWQSECDMVEWQARVVKSRFKETIMSSKNGKGGTAKDQKEKEKEKQKPCAGAGGGGKKGH